MELILCTLLGLLVGVIVNRAADNLPSPNQLSLLSAPRCAYCNHPRRIQQFAAVSFLLMRQRCPNCSSPLPMRAPVIEIVSALLFAYLWQKFGPTWQLAVYSIFTFALLVMLVIDFEHRLIFDVTSLPAVVFALLVAPITFSKAPSLAMLANVLGIAPSDFSLPEVANAYLFSFLGAVLGLLGGLGMYFFGAFTGARLLRARGQDGNIIPFGQGDVKLAAFVGAVVGVISIIPALVATILLGGLGAISIIAFNVIVHRRYNAAAVMPYGPYFILAAFYFLLR